MAVGTSESDNESEKHSDYRCQAHSLELDLSEVDCDAGESDNEYHRRERQVTRLGVVDLRIYHQSDTGSSDHSVEQEAHAAHYRTRDGLNESGCLADEGEQDREYRCSADYVYAVDLRDSHDTDVLAVSSCRAGAAESGERCREPVSKHRSVKTRILQEVFAYDLGCNYLVSDVFGYDYQRCRDYDGDSLSAPQRCLERRQLEHSCASDCGEVNKPKYESQDIARYYGDQDRYCTCESSVKDSAEYGQQQSYKENDQDLRVKISYHASVIAQDACCLSCTACKFKTYESYNRTHGRRRQDRIDPCSAYKLDDQSHKTHQKSRDYKAAEGISEAQVRI